MHAPLISIRSALLLLLLVLPSLARAADITGIAKVREADAVQIGSTRIRLGGLLVLSFALAYLLCYALLPMSVAALYLFDRTAYERAADDNAFSLCLTLRNYF